MILRVLNGELVDLTVDAIDAGLFDGAERFIVNGRQGSDFWMSGDFWNTLLGLWRDTDNIHQGLVGWFQGVGLWLGYEGAQNVVVNNVYRDLSEDHWHEHRSGYPRDGVVHHG